VVPTPGRALGLPDTRLGRRLRQRRLAIIETAAKRRARDVRVFGSVARGEDTAASDVDLLVELDDGDRIAFEGTPSDLVAARSTLTSAYLAAPIGA
jgi:predicted nucleotidyltransferase